MGKDRIGTSSRETSSRFSKGQEKAPDEAPEKSRRGRYSNGVAHRSRPPVRPRFSRGQETSENTSEKSREGRYSDGLEDLEFPTDGPRPRSA